MTPLPVLALLLALGAGLQTTTEVVSQVLVQGNVLTPDEEVRRLAGVEPGMPALPTIAEDAAGRLRATGRFERVEVRRRFASIQDPTQIVLIIVVDEGPVTIEGGRDGQPARVVARRGPRLLFLPIVGYEDGYGLTYGIRVSRPGPFGTGSRLSVPLTWGGDRRAGVEADKAFAAGPLSRIEAGASVSRRRHPFFDDAENRTGAWVTAERALLPQVRVRATAGWERAALLDRDDRFARTAAEVVVDTRVDPFLARNAVYARAAWERAHLRRNGGGRGIDRAVLDVRGYLGLPGRSVLVARAVREDAAGSVPPALKSILGGTANLRGYRRGRAVGDALAAGSVEWRLPLSSPLRTASFGVSAFVDAGRAYDDGAELDDGRLEHAIGGGVWLSIAVVRISVAVARAPGGAPRVHVGTGLSP